MRYVQQLAAGAAFATLVIAAPTLGFAQDQTPPATASAPPATSDQMSSGAQPSAPSADAAGVNTSVQPVPASQLPPGQVAALEQGDNKTLTNGPVPDTPANRAKYGKPMSHAGKKTAPAGN